MKRLGLALFALALAACDSGSSASDLVGVYEVTAHTRNEGACDTEGADVTDLAYFQLVEDDFLGQKFLSLAECDSAEPTSCSGGGLFSSFFKMGGEWVNQITASSGGGDTSCYLTFVHGTLVDEGDGAVRIETRTYSEVDDTLSEEECDPDTAEARGESMPCDSYEVLVGTMVSTDP